MATLKHISSKNSDYTAIEAYLVYQHDAFTGKQLLDEQGRPMLRESYIAERNDVSESYVARSEKFMRGVEIMEQMVPGMQEKILSGQFKVRDADMHRLARADFPNRKQIVYEILHPEDRPATQSSYSHYSGINYSALEAAVRRIQQDVDFLMRYLPNVPDDAYVKVETTKILKQHKAYMAQFEEMLNDKEIA